MLTGLIIASAVVVALALAGLIFVIRRNAFIELVTRGIRAYKYDVGRGLIKQYDDTRVRNPYRARALNRHLPAPRDWASVSYLTERLAESEGEKQLRQALHDLSKNPPTYSFTFNSALPGFNSRFFANNTFSVTLEFFRASEQLYVLLFKWRLMSQTTQRFVSTSIKPITREELAKLPDRVVAYIAFNTHRGLETRAKFVRIIGTIWNRPIYYFFDAGLLVFILAGRSVPTLNREVRRFTRAFNDRAAQLGAQQCFEGSAYIVAEAGQEVRTQPRMLQALAFFVTISVEKGLPFIALGTKDLDLAEFRLYDEGLKSFKSSVAEMTFDLNFVPVLSYRTEKELAVFARPHFRGLSPNMMRNILSNFSNQELLNNAVATRVAITKTSKSTLVNVSEDWLIRSYETIRNKRAAYIINLEDAKIKPETMRVAKWLKNEQITLGIKIQSVDETLLIALRELAPEFIVVAGSLIGEDGLLSSDAYIHLINIAELAKEIKARLIYENAPDYIDDLTAAKIGLKYHYNWE